jgi:hypothetical protein
VKIFLKFKGGFMKVDRKTLLGVLELLKPGLAKKELVEQASHYIFTGASAVTFNDQIMVSFPFDMEFPFSVRGEDLFNVLKSMKDEDVTFSKKEGNAVVIKGKNSVAELATIVTEESKVENLIDGVLKDIEENADNKFPVDPEFIDGLYKCSFSASRDLSQGVLACVHVENDVLFSSDKLRISKFTLSEDYGKIYIFAKDAVELRGYPTINEMLIADKWVHFFTDNGGIISCRLFGGEDFKGNLDKFFTMDKAETIELPKELKSIVDDVSVMVIAPTERQRFITVSFKKDKIICKGEGERGYYKKSIPFKSKEEFDFSINPKLFAEILVKTNNFQIDEKKAMFVSENFSHVISLPAKKKEETTNES